MPARPEIRLGTRGSQLALWQANTVAARIAETGGPPCRIITIKTSGDRLQEAPLSEVGGKRLFVKEIEDALLRNDVDIAVHSSKDMPAILPEGLEIGAVLPREDPRDALVLPDRAESVGPSFSSGGPLSSLDALIEVLGRTPTIGTSSVRRVAQLSRIFPHATFAPIRGNLDTRLRKLDAGDYDALVLAAAGLRRLGFGARISLALPADACIPSPGQGIVAIEIRRDDRAIRRVVARINDATAGAALRAERALVDALGGGCQTPIGALATAVRGGAEDLSLVATVISLDGQRVVNAAGRSTRAHAAALGAKVAARLIAEGASDILAEVQAAQNATPPTPSTGPSGTTEE